MPPARKKPTKSPKAAAKKQPGRKAAPRATKKRPAAVPAAPPPVVVVEPEPEFVCVFFGWYDNVRFAAGERARTILQIGVESHQDGQLIPLLTEKDVMLEITVRRLM
jgi:hypothetical protein